MIEWLPTVRSEKDLVAVFDVIVEVPSDVVPSKNSTEPVAPALTVAVATTAVPTVAVAPLSPSEIVESSLLTSTDFAAAVRAGW